MKHFLANIATCQDAGSMVVGLLCARWQDRGDRRKPFQWEAKKSAEHGEGRVEPQAPGDKITS